jgi:hypothetical protein
MIIYRHLKPNGEVFYIGIAKLKSRPYSKENRNKWWYNIVNKYGYEVQILKTDLTWKDACELEQILIAHYGRKDLGLGPLVNLTDGGEGVLGLKGNIGHTGKKHSEETKKRISEIKKGTPPPNKGIPMSQTQKDKLKGPRKTIINRLVLNLETGIYYDSITEAADSLNLKYTTFRNYLIGYRKNKTSMIYV